MEMSEFGKQKYSEKIRAEILENLKELSLKISKNENLPEKAQDLDFLYEIQDLVDNCLNNWRY
jgi:hypothetical protein